MTSGALHELRPRTPVELYDAALHVCMHTRSELPVLAVLGATPLAICAIWLFWLASHGQRFGAAAALLVAALVFRQLCRGAAGVSAMRELEGEPVSAARALRAALGRLPSMVICTGLLALANDVLFPLTLGLSALGLSVWEVGPVLIAEGSAHGWSFGRTARMRLRGRVGAAVSLRIFHGLALLLLLANLHGVIWVLLATGHTLLGLDLAFVNHMASLKHGFYDVCLVAVGQLLLEPLRCATQVLLLVDARVRREGFDLLAVLRRIRESSVARAAAVLLAVGLAFAPGRARAASEAVDAARQRADPVPALADLAGELGVRGAELDGPLARARALPKVERAKLVPLVRDLNRRLDADDAAGAKAELRAALGALGEPIATAGANPDPRAAVQEILLRPEFQDVAKRAADAERQAPSWWTRFWKWVQRELDKLAHQKRDPPRDLDKGFSLTGGTARLLTYGLVALAACVILVLAFRWFTRRAPSADTGGAAGGGAGGGDAVNALAKSAWAWSDEADALAAAGRFREAMRALYLALLASLHRRGAIDYDPAHSNWDYCAHFRGQADELEPFRELTQRFDFGWYGRMGADAAGYRAFRAVCGPLLTAAPEAHHA